MHPGSKKPKIIVICGPTGVGKTAAAIDVARQMDGQIISADAMQVYRYMDIGTAKPTPLEQEKVKHHMIDIVDPGDPFDAARYSFLARKKIAELHSQGIVSYIVGGTGLYIKALLHGLFPAKPSESGVRKRLKHEAAAIGSQALYRRLLIVDPETARRIHPHDAYRTIRALETFEATGEPISAYQRRHHFGDTPFTVLKIGLNIRRQALYERINQRVDAMIDAGFVNEVKTLLEMGYTADFKSMQAIGYRHLVAFIQGFLPWNKSIRTLKRDTRRYAKRQLTWFRADPEIMWTEPTETKDMQAQIKKFLQSAE